MKLKLLTFICFIFNIIQATQIIILMGPSCAGKSTLSQYVSTKLIEKGEEWIVIDFDEVEEDMEQLIAIANEYLEKNINIIIDTNTYENDIENKFIGEVIITKIIVTAPLNVLLQRDEKRTQRLNRNKQRAF